MADAREKVEVLAIMREAELAMAERAGAANGVAAWSGTEQDCRRRAHMLGKMIEEKGGVR